MALSGVGAPPFSGGSLAETNSSAGTDQSRFALESRFWPGTGSGVGEIHAPISRLGQDSGHPGIPGWNVASACGGAGPHGHIPNRNMVPYTASTIRVGLRERRRWG